MSAPSERHRLPLMARQIKWQELWSVLLAEPNVVDPVPNPSPGSDDGAGPVVRVFLADRAPAEEAQPERGS